MEVCTIVARVEEDLYGVKINTAKSATPVPSLWLIRDGEASRVAASGQRQRLLVCGAEQDTLYLLDEDGIPWRAWMADAGHPTQPHPGNPVKKGM